MRKSKGFVMVVALVIICALLIVATAIGTYATSSYKFTVVDQGNKKCKYIAEGGIESAIVKLKNIGINPDAIIYPLPDPIPIPLENSAKVLPADFYKYDFNDIDTGINCHIEISIIVEEIDGERRECFQLVSNASNPADGKSFKIVSLVDIEKSFRENDYISDIGSKTITSIGDINSVDSPIFMVNSNLDITGSFLIHNKEASFGPSYKMTVNNSDKNHSGDSKIKLNGNSDLTIDTNNIKDLTKYKWFGDFKNNKYVLDITPISLKRKQLLSIDKSESKVEPEFFKATKDGENDMVLWQMPTTSSGIVFSDIPIKNFIINRLKEVFQEYLFVPEDGIDPANNGFEDYVANSEVDDIKIEEMYRNLYKVILVDGDLYWNQPDYFSQSINWVIYCTGTIYFTSEFIQDKEISETEIKENPLSDNMNCTFMAKGFVFDNDTLQKLGKVSKGKLDTRISFCNLKEDQKKALFGFLKKNLRNYYDGIDIRIVKWTEQ